MQLANLLSLHVKGYIWKCMCVTVDKHDFFLRVFWLNPSLCKLHPALLTVQQALERHHCYKACWSWPKPANEAAVQPSFSTTICLMNCQSLSRSWPSPKSRGNQSLWVWTLNYSLLLKPWVQAKAFLGTRCFLWKWFSVLVKRVKIVALDLCKIIYFFGVVYMFAFKDSVVH